MPSLLLTVLESARVQGGVQKAAGRGNGIAGRRRRRRSRRRSRRRNAFHVRCGRPVTIGESFWCTLVIYARKYVHTCFGTRSCKH